MKKAKGKSGFTLIEVLIVLVVSAIVFLGAYEFFSQQQKTFNQQTAQARQQSNLRMAIYYLTQDLINAGFTGTPFGIEGAIYTAKDKGFSTPVRVVRTISPGGEFPSLTNSQGDALNILEIWGNFNAQSTTLTSVVSAGMSTIFVQDASIFELNIWDESTGAMTTVHPPGFIIGSVYYRAEYHSLRVVDTSNNSITSSEMIVQNYNPGTDLVAPVWKRVYFVQEDAQGTRYLIRRDYYMETTQDTQIADNIVDFQVYFDIKNPTTGDLTLKVDPDTTTVDPCTIRAVIIQLTGRVFAPGTRPTFLTTNRRVVIPNLWNHPLFDNQCLTVP